MQAAQGPGATLAGVSPSVGRFVSSPLFKTSLPRTRVKRVAAPLERQAVEVSSDDQRQLPGNRGQRDALRGERLPVVDLGLRRALIAAADACVGCCSRFQGMRHSAAGTAQRSVERGCTPRACSSGCCLMKPSRARHSRCAWAACGGERRGGREEAVWQGIRGTRAAACHRAPKHAGKHSLSPLQYARLALALMSGKRGSQNRWVLAATKCRCVARSLSSAITAESSRCRTACQKRPCRPGSRQSPKRMACVEGGEGGGGPRRGERCQGGAAKQQGEPSRAICAALPRNHLAAAQRVPPR